MQCNSLKVLPVVIIIGGKIVCRLTTIEEANESNDLALNLLLALGLEAVRGRQPKPLKIQNYRYMAQL